MIFLCGSDPPISGGPSTLAAGADGSGTGSSMRSSSLGGGSAIQAGSQAGSQVVSCRFHSIFFTAGTPGPLQC